MAGISWFFPTISLAKIQFYCLTGKCASFIWLIRCTWIGASNYWFTYRTLCSIYLATIFAIENYLEGFCPLCSHFFTLFLKRAGGNFSIKYLARLLDKGRLNMMPSFLPKCQPKILRISALPSSKLWLTFWEKRCHHKFILYLTDLYILQSGHISKFFKEYNLHFI